MSAASVCFPKVYVAAVRPTVADDTQPSRGYLKDLGAVVVLKAIVQDVLNPRSSLWFGLLVHQQPASAAVRLEGIVLSDDDFEFTIAIQVGYIERVR